MIDRVHGGDAGQYFKNGLFVKHKIVDFSVNINPLGFPPKTKTVIIKNIDGLIRYPQAGSENLKKSLAVFHGIKEENLAVGNGSVELIYSIPRALKAKKVLIITPAFSEYEFAARCSGAEILFFKTFERENFKIEFHRLRKFLSGVDLVFLGNPNNPAGFCLNFREASLLAELCASCKAVLMIDEVFMDFVKDGEKNSLLHLALANKFLIVLKSLTKFFALPGLRIGYTVSPAPLAGRIAGTQCPWNVNSLAQAVGIEVLKNTGFMRYTKAYITEQRRFLFSSLKDIEELKVFEPNSNFILCKLKKSAVKNARALNEKLIKRGMLVRDCGNFRGLNERFFRAAVRTQDENCKLIKVLKEIL